MKSILASVALAASTLLPASASAEMSNKDMVVNAVTELFIKGDITTLSRNWAKNYIQHNPQIPDGLDAIKGFFSKPIPGFKYEIGNVIADGDLIAIHGRYTGFGPRPMIAVDIFRVENGKIAEHWDVLQEEIVATASGNPMFAPKK